MNDLRYGFRQLRKAPGFTITALATVAICLGANLAIFAVIDSVLLKPLPFPHADRLVSIYNTYHPKGMEFIGISLDDDGAKMVDVAKQKNFTWPQYFDGKAWKNELAEEHLRPAKAGRL